MSELTPEPDYTGGESQKEKTSLQIHLYKAVANLILLD
jgi:hypothetical protein